MSTNQLAPVDASAVVSAVAPAPDVRPSLVDALDVLRELVAAHESLERERYASVPIEQWHEHETNMRRLSARLVAAWVAARALTGEAS